MGFVAGFFIASRPGSGDDPCMSAKAVTVVALMRAKPGKEADLRQELLALVPITHKEPGCLNYDLHVDPQNPAAFCFHENWTSKQHLDDHLARPHLQAFLAKAGGLLAEPPQILLYEKIG
jgi:quinol monooxygenase YgiN